MTVLIQMAAVFALVLFAIWLISRVFLGPSKTTTRALQQSKGEPPTHGQGW